MVGNPEPAKTEQDEGANPAGEQLQDAVREDMASCDFCPNIREIQRGIRKADLCGWAGHPLRRASPHVRVGIDLRSPMQQR